MPLTWQQLQHLSLPVVLDRLIERRLFPLALAVTERLSVPHLRSNVLTHWAHHKMLSCANVPDDELARTLKEKLHKESLCYTDVADLAAKLNRPGLAVKLLNYENRPKAQIVGLLNLKERSTALAKAKESGDVDLVLTVLQHTKNVLPLADFLMVVSGSDFCRSVYASSCSKESLRDLYIQEDNFKEQGKLRVMEAYDTSKTDTRLNLLQASLDCFKRAKDECNAHLTSDQIALLKMQIALEKDHARSYINLSLSDTISQLIVDNHIKKAEQIRDEFKLPDRWCVF